MAVALGGLTLVVAARAGESGQQQDAVTVDDPSAGVVASAGEGVGGSPSLPGLGAGLPQLAGDDAVRLLDFGDIDQSGDTCSEGLAGDAPGVIPVEEGQSEVLDPERNVRLEVGGAEAYGDLDGDGSDEAVVRALCAYGANGEQDTIQVWDVESGRAVTSASLAEPPSTIESRFPPSVADVTIENGEVVVTWQHFGDDDPHCCPSQETRVRYDMVGDELLVNGAPEAD